MLKTTQNIDRYNLFELMGLTSLSGGEKHHFLQEIYSLVWSEFLLIRLDKLLTRDQLDTIVNLAKSGVSPDIILDSLSREIPNLSGLLADFTREVKERILLEYYSKQISNLDDELSLIENEQERKKFEQKINFFNEAKDLAIAKKWAKLDNYIKSQSMDSN